ncbi:hypothetical protein D3C76_754000 [compost metagenome]
MDLDGMMLMRGSGWIQGCRAVGAGVSALCLAVLMVGCANDSDLLAQKPIKTEASAAPIATDSSLYAEIIGSGTFERSSIKLEQGRTVESGVVKTKDGKVGGLVIVRAPNGVVTAIVNSSEKRGLLLVDSQGKSTFKAEPTLDWLTPDSVAGDSASLQKSKEKETASHKYVDMLVAYTLYGLGKLEADPVDFAIAQVESANLGLRNSLVPGISLRLAAVKIIDGAGVDYSTSGQGLRNWQTLLEPDKQLFGADVSTSFDSGTGVAGLAYKPGLTSVNAWWAPTAFPHELGHNAGGSHCNSGQASYKFGHSNGKSNTFLCGNNVPYYSTTRVRDQDGQPLGNAATADMARVWEENTARMTGYSPELPGERMILAGTASDVVANLRIVPENSNPSAGVVALSSDVGPTSLQALPGGGYTTLTVKLKNDAGAEFPVKLRAQRSIGGCVRSGMNNNAGCQGGGSLFFTLRYLASDNLTLPKGMYNGVLKLEARDSGLTGWVTPITISISIASRHGRIIPISTNTCFTPSPSGGFPKPIQWPTCHETNASNFWEWREDNKFYRSGKPLVYSTADNKLYLNDTSAAYPAMEIVHLGQVNGFEKVKLKHGNLCGFNDWGLGVAPCSDHPNQTFYFR